MSKKSPKKYSHLRHRYFVLTIKSDIDFIVGERDKLKKLDESFKKIFMSNKYEFFHAKDGDALKNIKNVERLAYLGKDQNNKAMSQMLVEASFYDTLTFNKIYIKKQMLEIYPELNYKLEISTLTKKEYGQIMGLFADKRKELYND